MRSVNTYTSVIGFSTEDKYLMKCLKENKKYEAEQLLKMFPNKNWGLGGLKSLIKKLTTQVLLFDVLGSGQPRTLCAVPVLSLIFDQRFQSTKTSVFVRKHFKQSPCSVFLIFSQRFDPVLIFSANSH